MSTQENLNTRNVVKVLVIGETGSGKSTLINYITNYFLKGTLENLKVAIPCEARPQVTEQFQHSENKIHDATQSQTDACHQYLFANEIGQFLFLDTPGLSDTRGPTQDDINIQKITDAVQQLDGLTSVIIVVNGAICRLTLNLKNVIACLRGNMPDVVMDNVIVVLTNAKRHEASFKVQALELHGNVYPYYFQNSAFATEPSKWTVSAKDALRRDWEISMRELKNMVTTLKSFTAKSVTAFREIKDIRNEIKTLMHAAQVEVTEIQKMQDEIAAFNVALKRVEVDKNVYQKYTEERIVEHIEIVDATHHSTLCQNCNFVCHERCQLDETTIVGSQIFMRCWAMATNGACRKCPHQCSYTAHYHARKTVQRSRRKLQHVLADIKAKYDRAVVDKSDIKKKITTADEAKTLLERALRQKHANIREKCMELRRYCCGFNLAQELSTLIGQLEVQARLLKNIDAKLQAEEFIRSLKELCTQLENDQETSKQNLRPMRLIDTAVPEDDLVRPRTPCRGASISQPQSQSTDPSSHASSDVLALLRRLNNDVDEPSKTTSDDSEDDRSSTRTSQEKPIKKSNKQKEDFDPNQFKTMTIRELIHKYRTCTDDRISNSIVHELGLRSRGESSFTLTAAETIRFTTMTNENGSLNGTALKEKYKDVATKIAEKTGPDIIQIERISQATLLEVRALYELTQIMPESTSPSVTTVTLTPRHAPPVNAHITNSTDERCDQHRNCHCHQPIICNHQPRPQHDRCSCAHCSHYSIHPQQHCMCESARPAYLQSHSNIYPTSNRHHINEEPPPYRYVSMTRQHDHRGNTTQAPIAEISSHPIFGAPNISRRQSDDDIFANLLPTTNIDLLSPRTRTHENTYRAWTTTALINAYKDSSMQHDIHRKNLIKEELKQRCFGNYPTLIAENASDFDKHYQAHKGESFRELKRNYEALKEFISSHLFNDYTNITFVPKASIIQAAALIKCMNEKEKS